jgi:hypothetical protein
VIFGQAEHYSMYVRNHHSHTSCPRQELLLGRKKNLSLLLLLGTRADERGHFTTWGEGDHFLFDFFSDDKARLRREGKAGLSL